jgi:hypothetical protein
MHMVRASLVPSRRLAAVLSLVHAAAVGAIVPLDMPLAIKIGLVLAVVVSLVHSIRRHSLLRSKRSVIAIEVSDRHAAAIQGRDGVWHDARILGSSYVTAQLTMLNLRVTGERLARHVLVIPGNVDEEEFRRMRVRLRWSRALAPDGNAALR